MKQIIGCVLILLPFIAVFIFSYYSAGFKETITGFGMVMFAAGLFAAGSWLIDEG